MVCTIEMRSFNEGKRLGVSLVKDTAATYDACQWD